MHFCKHVKVLSPDIDRVIEVLSACEAERQVREGKLSIHEQHPTKGVTWTRRLKEATAVFGRPGSYGIQRRRSDVGSILFSHHGTYERQFADGRIEVAAGYHIEAFADEGLAIRSW